MNTRVVQALIRSDLRAVRAILAGVLGLAVCGVLVAHSAFDIATADVDRALLRASVLIAGLVAIPIVAELLSCDERTGIADLARSLPLRGVEVVLAKLVSIAAVVALVAAGVLAAEFVASSSGAIVADRLPSIGELLEWSRRAGAVGFYAGWPLVVTAATAVVTRNPLAASAAGIAFAVGTWGLAATGVFTEYAHVQLNLVRVLGHPAVVLAAAAGVVLVGAARGPFARRPAARGLALAGGPTLVAALAAGAAALSTWIAGPPAFGDPRARLCWMEISRDGRFIAATTLHPGWIWSGQELWIVDVGTGAARRVEEQSTRWDPLGRHDVRPVGWSVRDGRLLTSITAGRGPASYVSIDPDTGDLEPADHEDVVRQCAFHGVDISRDSAAPGRGLVKLADGSLFDVGNQLSQVPERSRDAVFFADDGGQLRRLDLSTGEVHVFDVQVGANEAISVGPFGETVCLEPRTKGRELIDLRTGRRRSIERRDSDWMRRGASVGFMRRHAGAWTFDSIDGSEPIEFERDVRRVWDLDGRRWLGQDARSGLHVFDVDGELILSLR
ncbi:MAG: hypothetical protein AAF726_14660 [Planctomycetota bacterium]